MCVYGRAKVLVVAADNDGGTVRSTLAWLVVHQSPSSGLYRRKEVVERRCALLVLLLSHLCRNVISCVF